MSGYMSGSMDIKRQKEALTFFKKVIFRPVKVTKGQKTKKGQKGQISNMIESSQTIRQNEAFDVIFSKIFVSRSFKVTRGQES